MADIQSMFYCFLVRDDHRNFLRFLWYEENNPDKDLVEYRMRVHVFGNKPSSSVASYGLHKGAAVMKDQYGKDVTNFVQRNFYVDDGLVSLPSTEQAIDLLQRTQTALSLGGNLRLHKIASNSPEVMKSFPTEDRAKDLMDLDFDKDIMPLQRSLGLVWDLHDDNFTFRVCPGDKPYSRRGILSTVSSLFDPIGFAAPITVQGKILLRQLMKEVTGWDEPLSPVHQSLWDHWKTSLKSLDQLNVSRMYSHVSLQEAADKSVYIFSDASEQAISAVGYLRTLDNDGNHSMGFILGKAKVAPSHGHTIPRLELCGAVLAIEIAETISDQLDLDLQSFHYFTDSKVVLGYLCNNIKRFKVYVTNRVQRILKSSNSHQWSYIPSECNPADVATRPIATQDLSSSAWLLGPPKLPPFTEHETFSPTHSEEETIPEVVSISTSVKSSLLGSQRFERFSCWQKIVKAIDSLQHIARTFKGENLCKGWHICPDSKTVETFNSTELWIIKQTQDEVYYSEIKCLRNKTRLHKTSPILPLDPFLDSDGVLRVGGRLKHAKLPSLMKNPIIIPGRHHIATLLVRRYHESIQHQGHHFTEGAIRSAGLWITGSTRLINSILFKCVRCRKLRSQTSHQKMSDLPVDRLTPAPPFTFVGVDAFGPWQIVTRRTRGGSSSSKRWAILFTCMASRAVHIEVIEEMSSSSFINAMRRFQAIRGKVKQYRSDRGTNFTGATGELKIDTINVEDSPMSTFLYNSGVQWIFNPPHSSHMGGSWERMIGIARRILESMLSQVSTKNLTHEVLVTLMSEVCAIINNRPLVPVSSDPECPEILSPSSILTMKNDYLTTTLPDTDISDLYKAQWRRVQYLADTFWRRWKAEYLQTLQQRQKWRDNQPNVKSGDVALLKDKNCARNEWPTGIIVDAIPGEDGRVRKAVVRVVKNGKPVQYTRPISEIVVLLSD